MPIRRPGDRSVRRAVPLTLVLLGGCGDGPSVPLPSDELTVREEGALGVYHRAPDDSVDVESQEAYYAWLFDRLGVTPAEPLVYLKYRNRSHMARVTGKRVNGWAELGTYRFHTIWPLDDHESVHALVTSVWNAAPALMNEGFAVAHQVPVRRGGTEPTWNGTPVDTLAARALRSGTLPPLGTMLDSRDFRRHGEALSYPVAGSFVKSVLERHGYRAAKSFFRSSTLEDRAERLRANFRNAFGEGIEEAWAAWLSSLR